MPETDADDYGFGDYCPICEGFMEFECCWSCYGEGGYHDCGEDCCCCLDKEEITHDCEECGGKGGYLVCCHLPHSDAQVEAWRRKQADTTAMEPNQHNTTRSPGCDNPEVK